MFLIKKEYFLLSMILISSPVCFQAKSQIIHTPQLPGINMYNEHREIVDVAQKPWNIIGRVQSDLGQKCTGFLISPRVVMTAAHCVWIKKTQHFIQPSSLHFALQYQRQKYKAVSDVLKVVVPEDYNKQTLKNKSLSNLVFDRAYLILSKALLSSAEIIPFQKNNVGNMPIMLGGYEQDRIEVLYADKNCSIQNKLAPNEINDSILIHNCQGTYGSSGAPLFTKDTDGQWYIVGIQIAAFPNKAGGIAAVINIPTLDNHEKEN